MFTPQDQTMFHSVLDKLHSFGAALHKAADVVRKLALKTVA